MFHYAWKMLLIYASISGSVYLLVKCFGFETAGLPFLPISLIGMVVAFFLGFKNNSSYDRLWEAQQTWGRIVNNSRNWASTVLHHIRNQLPENSSQEAELHLIRKELVYRQIAFTNALRYQLRMSNTRSKTDTSRKLVTQSHLETKKSMRDELIPFLDESEISFLETKTNVAAHILNRQYARLTELNDLGILETTAKFEMAQVITENYRCQGECESIKLFPLPRQYSYFSKVFVWIFILLLPFGLLSEFEKASDTVVWLMIPSHILISWVFMVTEQIGDDSENPFENAINDIPMTAICRNIEIDLREFLGETELPSKLEPVNNILL